MTPLIIVISTCLIGYLLRGKKIPAVPDTVMSCIVWALLLLFGIAIGTNPQTVANIPVYGLQALAIALLTILGSVLGVRLLHHLKRRKDEK